MLLRLILIVVIAVLGVTAVRRFLRGMTSSVRLTEEENATLRDASARHPAVAEALDARARIYEIPGAKDDVAVVDDVERAMMELLHHVTLLQNIARGRASVWSDTAALSLISIDTRIAKLKESAASADDVTALERERETLLRQRAAATRMDEQKTRLESDTRELSLGLRDLHVALVELSTTQGGLKKGDTKGAASQLRSTSENVRQRADAFETVESLLDENVVVVHQEQKRSTS